MTKKKLSITKNYCCELFLPIQYIMKRVSSFFCFFTLFWSISSYSQELSCRHIYKIQNLFLKHHILSIKYTPELRNRVLSQFIKSLDREKIYFLQSDILNIKRKNKRIFSDLKKQKCLGLYYIYNIYSKRVSERMNYAKTLLNDKFLFSKKAKYILDEDLKKHPKTIAEANENMKTYIQYLVANVFLFEKDLKKAVTQVSHILNKDKKQVLSWKPQLNPIERRHCRKKSKDSFKACKPTKWFSNYLNAYSQSLDSHSSYMDREDREEFYIQMNLALEGIGATLSSRFGYTIVEGLVPGGAAFRSKQIKVKDKILEVGQKKDKLINIFGERIEDVVSIIRGPKGTSVFLKILREGKDGKNITSVVKLIRDRVDLQEEAASISYHNKKIKGKNYKIGLLKVPSFYGSQGLGKSVTKDIKDILFSAKKQKIQALVLDLSNNRGGSLDEAVDLSGLFFAKGNVVKQSEKNNSRTQILRDNDKRVFYEGPLVVLTNRLSASASEIVAGTLQDYQRAVIVGGDYTFGKGSIQSVEEIFLGALKTTVGLYFIPSGKSTQKIGISSDIVFPSLLNIEDLGEKSLDYTLPSQTVKSFKSPPTEIFSLEKTNWKPISKNIIKELKIYSEERIEKNKKFQKIKKLLVKRKEKKTKNRKEITIAEILKNEEEKEEKPDKTEELSRTEKSKKRYLERPDIQEALNVAGDLALALGQAIKKTSKN